MKSFHRILFVVLLLCGASLHAQTESARASEFEAAVKDAQALKVTGPVSVKLAGEAVLNLPLGFVFIPMPAAGRLLHAMGNSADPALVGVVFPAGKENWMAVVQFERAGYIKDDDARDWDVDQLLRGVREGTREGNEERRKLGFPELAIAGWAEKPRYDINNHRLVWAIEAHEAGPTPNADPVVNYNTYALGRDGFFKFNLVTGLSELPAQKPLAETLLASLQYDEGKRYGDFQTGDRVAEFGVAALIAGVAAKKLGFLGLLGAFALKFIKFIIITLLALGAGLALWLWRKKGMPRGRDEDFPSTELKSSALDEPTVLLAVGAAIAAAGVPPIPPTPPLPPDAGGRHLES